MSLYNYHCDEIKRIIDEVSPNYPQLTTYTSEWLYFYENEYTPGTPVDLEYQEVIVNPTGMISNAIPYHYKSAILKGNTKYRDIDTGDILDTFDETKNLELVSVKVPVLTTTGKNIFDGAYNKDKYLHSDGTEKNSDGWATTTNFIPVKPSTTYTQNIGKNSSIAYVVFYDKQKNVIDSISQTTNHWRTYTTPSNCYFIKTCFKFVETIEPYHFQIEEGSIATSYEPYKSNILTVNEEVELRGIGDGRDELDLLTGKLTQRIGEVVFDGSEDWVQSSHENSTMFYTSFNNLAHKGYYQNSISCDKLVVHDNETHLFNATSNGISAYADWTDTYPNENWIYIKYTDSEGSVEKLKQWLSQNPITVQYELATESVKTVDLTKLDKPYEGVNNYYLTANIPCEAVLEVPVVSTGEQTLKEING